MQNGQHMGVFENDTYDCFREKAEYWVDVVVGGHTPNSYFTKGVHASRNLSTCTIQDVFWETDLKKLYRCTATNTWTPVYQPFTCPHPLADPGAAGSCDQGTPGIGGYHAGVMGERMVLGSGGAGAIITLGAP